MNKEWLTPSLEVLDVKMTETGSGNANDWNLTDNVADIGNRGNHNGRLDS